MNDQTHGIASHILVLGETNLSKASSGFTYSIVTAYVPRRDGSMVKTEKIIWHDEPQGSGDELLAQAESGEMAGVGKVSKLDAAINFLKEILRNGPLPFPKILSQALAVGIRKGTLIRAKEQIGIDSDKQKGAGQDSPFVWSLPSSEAE